MRRAIIVVAVVIVIAIAAVIFILNAKTGSGHSGYGY